ncbi:MAG: hypothetical protein KAX15_01310 [Candidatus Omnitrophica bacterium]|nr:hypothetical protein [Candidatus Omnitrophota bacterium]
MKEQMKLLIKLQEIDKQIFEINSDKEIKPAKFEELKAAYEAEQVHLAELNEELKGLQVRRKDQEGELEAKEVNIKKYQTQLSQVKTNKEYSALQHEIDGLKADSSLIEDKILKIMEEVDSLDTKIRNEQERLKKEEIQMKEKEDLITRELTEIDRKLFSLSNEREKIIPEIKPEVLARYEKIQNKKSDGIALVKIEDDSCQGCNMILPPQVISEVIIGTRIHNCESCVRLLYYEPKENNDSV